MQKPPTLAVTKAIVAGDPVRAAWVDALGTVGSESSALIWTDTNGKHPRYHLILGETPDLDGVSFQGSSVSGDFRVSHVGGSLIKEWWAVTPANEKAPTLDGLDLPEPFSHDSMSIAYDLESPGEVDHMDDRVDIRIQLLDAVAAALDHDHQGFKDAQDAVDEVFRYERSIPDSDPEVECYQAVTKALLSGKPLGPSLLAWAETIEWWGHLNGASAMYEVAYRCSILERSPEAAYESLRFRGRTLRKLGQFEGALKHCRLSQDVAAAMGNALLHGLVTDGLANVLRDMGRWAEAEAIWKALTESELTEIQALGHHSLLNARRQQGQIEEAATHGWEAIKRYRDEQKRGWATLDLGGILHDLGMSDAAMDAFTIVLANVDAVEYRAMAMFNTGLIHAERGEEQSARASWDRAQELSISPQVMTTGLEQVVHGLAALGKLDEAYEVVDQIEQIAERYRMAKVIIDSDSLRDYLSEETPKARPDSGTTSKVLVEVETGLREMAAAI